MNYNDVVNRFQEVVESHKMLVDFGYGQVSDIKTRSEGADADGTDYPYLFLNPGIHNREQSEITYNFNMIIMDMAREEESSEYQNFLNIQSDCIQYCDDVIARLYYFYKDQPEISFSASYTPFYERFQDQLAGATASISITVPNSINDCISPFDNVVQSYSSPEDLVILKWNASLANTDINFRANLSGEVSGQYRIDFVGKMINTATVPEGLNVISMEGNLVPAQGPALGGYPTAINEKYTMSISGEFYYDAQSTNSTVDIILGQAALPDDNSLADLLAGSTLKIIKL